VRAPANRQQISAVFRLQNKPDQPEAKYPSYYVKFKGSPDQLFQVGCLDFLNSFAQSGTQSLNFAETAIPLPDAHVLPYLARDVPEEPMGSEVTGQKGIRRLSCRASSMPLPQPAPLQQKPSRAEGDDATSLLHVEKSDASYFVYSWSGGSRVVDCPGATESDILLAFNFAEGTSAVEALPQDPRVQAADLAEPLRCVNPLFPAPLSIGFQTVDEQSARRAYKVSRESSELYTFGCKNAEDFFVGDTISEGNYLPISVQSLDYLLSHPNLTIQTATVDRVHLPCSGLSQAAYEKYFQDIYWAALGRLATADELNQKITSWKAARIPLTEENAADLRWFLSLPVKSDAGLRRSLVHQAIHEAKLTHQRFPGMDGGAVYPYEFGYFDYYISREAKDQDLRKGIYRNVLEWIRSNRAHLPRSMIDRSNDLVYGCNLGRTDCTPESDYSVIFQFMYYNFGKDLTQDDLVREHERWLDSCSNNTGDPSCTRSFRILAENVCNKNRGSYCPDSERSWLLPKISGEAISGPGRWIYPNKASIQCYLRMRYENPNFPCDFHTLDSAAAPFTY
jgi:hypothetical protein